MENICQLVIAAHKYHLLDTDSCFRTITFSIDIYKEYNFYFAPHAAPESLTYHLAPESQIKKINQNVLNFILYV